MHTTSFQVEGHGEVLVAHNADWSGDATIIYKSGKKQKRVDLPGGLLQALGMEAARDKIRDGLISYLERWP